jgi:hypothetical protein
MDVSEFRATLIAPEPPRDLRLALQALWWDAKGDWDGAHNCAQDQDDAEGAAVHAYLHRKEGDLPNASYWYSRAGRAVVSGGLDDEWRALADELLRS